MNIPYLNFDSINSAIGDELVETFQSFLDSQWYVLGEGVKQFEKELADYHGVKYAIGVASGLDAIIIALKAMNIGEGDEVIVPSNTYIATWLAISTVGAVIVPVEPDPHSYNVTADKIKDVITDKTKAILPVHLYGLPCEMEEIMVLAEAKEIYVIEDNAQAIGGKCGNKKTGSFGHINACSFYPGKNLGALGDAGAILTNNSDWADRCKSIRNYGSHIKYHNECLGMNSRIDELQARILSVKLPHLESWTTERIKIASKYVEALTELDEIQLPRVDSRLVHVYHIFPIKVQRRDKLQEYLREYGIQTMIHYPVPPHLQEAYGHLGYKKGDFPIAEKIAETEISLPIYPGMSNNMVDYVVEKIKLFYK